MMISVGLGFQNVEGYQDSIDSYRHTPGRKTMSQRLSSAVRRWTWISPSSGSRRTSSRLRFERRASTPAAERADAARPLDAADPNPPLVELADRGPGARGGVRREPVEVGVDPTDVEPELVDRGRGTERRSGVRQGDVTSGGSAEAGLTLGRLPRNAEELHLLEERNRFFGVRDPDRTRPPDETGPKTDHLGDRATDPILGSIQELCATVFGTEEGSEGDLGVPEPPDEHPGWGGAGQFLALDHRECALKGVVSQQEGADRLPAEQLGRSAPKAHRGVFPKTRDRPSETRGGVNPGKRRGGEGLGHTVRTRKARGAIWTVQRR
jgi:hypothetical protein